jgi:hypothetical protein
MKTRNFDLIGAMVKVAGLVLFGALVFPEQAKFILIVSVPIGIVQEFIAAKMGWW